jgi:hypothetical protein
MKTLRQARTGFLAEMRRKTSDGDAPKFEAILDDLIAWSQTRPFVLHHSKKAYKQEVVAFERIQDRLMIWSAYPRTNGKSDVGLLGDSRGKLPESFRREVLGELEMLTADPVEEGGELRLRFSALESSATRARLKQILGRVLDEPVRQPIPPSSA